MGFRQVYPCTGTFQCFSADVVNLSEALRALSVHPGATRPIFPPGCDTWREHPHEEKSRKLYAFGFMLHYNTLKTNSANRMNKLYFSPINLVYSIRTPSAVALRPIRIATSLHASSSKILYRIIRCILIGMVFSHASTSCFILSAFRSRSRKISSRRSSSPGSLTVGYASPSR